MRAGVGGVSGPALMPLAPASQRVALFGSLPSRQGTQIDSTRGARDAHHDRQAADVRDPKPDRRGHRDIPSDPGAARRSRGLFRGPRRDQGGDRADPKEARFRQAADRTVLSLHQRSCPWRFRHLADHGPARCDRNPQPPAGVRGTNAARTLHLRHDRASIGCACRNPAGLVDRSPLPRDDDRRRVAAGILHRSPAGLRLLLPAWLVARAARAMCFTAHRRR